ncbi:MAG: acyl--CoA ligase [Halioglobus sp.]|nr:acyl--CoA ligase [Halioglobus sp.]
MRVHRFVEDASLSIARGIPLEEEPGLGALTLPGFIREVTTRFTEREALTQMRTDGAVERWTYRELWQNSLAVAKSLVDCGIGKGERVGILMTNRAEFLASVFGTALAGGIATPLSTFSTTSELEYLLGVSTCSILLFERRVLKKDFAQTLLEIEPKIPMAQPGQLSSHKFPYLRHLVVLDGDESTGALESWDAFLSRGIDVAEAVIDARATSITPADPGMLFFSSGSTNRPKGILSAHRGVSIQLWRMGNQQGLEDGVRSWTANGFFWSGNFAMIVGGTLARGGSLVLQRTFGPEEALELMARERVSFLFAWPHQWAQLCDAPNWATVDLSALQFIDIDSPIARHPTVKTQWIEPRHCYGNTETFTLSTGYPAGTSREEAGDSHGLPLPGNTIKVIDPLTGRVVPIGERGEIVVKGPTLMLGYVGIPLDETLDSDGFFRTGDGGYIDGEGRVFWEGRLTDIIKTGGANVSPLEIDEVIRECPGVKVVQTIGVPHDTLGEMVVTCIVKHENTAISEETVRGFAKEKLASYKLPRSVLFFDADDIQLTGSAKVKTADLRELAIAKLSGRGIAK